MKWILLLALFACSTQDKVLPAKIDTPAGSPTESEAKPVSPLTVRPCYCMKMFQPVCAGGMSYGNSCEAECHGHKSWKEGSCPPKK